MKLSQIEAKLIDCMGTDLSVVNAARVSFDKESEWEVRGLSYYEEVEKAEEEGWEDVTDYDRDCGYFVQKLSDKDVKLITYLAKHKHFSPFNHTFLTFRVKAPIFVARQLVKHRFMPWNEVSRRYVDSEPEFYFPEYWRKKSDSAKQGSSEEKWDNINEHDHKQIESCLDYYQGLLSHGVCPEQARMVLPQNTMTEWMWSGTLGAYADMLKLRLDPHTQYESRIVANLIKEQIAEKFPVSLTALLENK